MDAGINLLRLRFAKHPEWFRSNRICFIDSMMTTLWKAKYPEFDAYPANDDGSGKLLPPGCMDYYTGELPLYCQAFRTWGVDVDDIYCPLFVKKDHWAALWISIPNRHIVVWDSIYTYATDEEIAELVTPVSYILPCTIRDSCLAEDRYKWSYDRFTHERIKVGIPQNKQSGDCGVFALKYIECHALGVPFTSGLSDANIGAIRRKLAGEIYDETGLMGTEERTDYNLWDLYDRQ